MKRTITLNQGFAARERHASVTCTAEPIVHTFDDAKLGEGPARAIAKLVREQIAAIKELAAPATIAKREAAKRALARGARWAVERYGTRPPTGSRKLFVDSGRLGEVLVRAAGAAWEVVAPSDRLDRESFEAADFTRMLQRLVELVPVLRAPLEQPAVRRAIEATLGQILTVRR